MSHGLNIHDGLGMIARDPDRGILLAYGVNVPALNAVGYAPGCKFIKINGDSLSTIEFINSGTKTAANFVAASLGAAVSVSYVWGDAAPADGAFFVADRAYSVVSINVRINTPGSDVGAVTGVIRKAPSATAIASGTQINTGSINLKGTVDTNQVIGLNSNPIVVRVPNGNALGLDVTGVTTAARGVVTVLMVPSI